MLAEGSVKKVGAEKLGNVAQALTALKLRMPSSTQTIGKAYCFRLKHFASADLCGGSFQQTGSDGSNSSKAFAR
jgi:hypothetical protein